MIQILIYVTLLVYFWLGMNKFKILTLLIMPSTIFLLINALSTLVFLAYSDNYYLDDVKFKEAIIFYLGLLLLPLIVLSVSGSERTLYSIRLNSTSFKKNNIGSDFSKVLIKYRSAICWFILLDFGLILNYLFTVNLELLFQNKEYLLILQPTKMDVTNPITIMYMQLQFLISIIIFILFGALGSIKVNLIYKIITFCCVSFHAVHYLAVSSRGTGLLFACFFLSFVINEKNKIRLGFGVPLTLILVIFSYLYALFGRAQIYQGVSVIPENIIKMFDNDAYSSEFILLNLFAGTETFYLGNLNNDTYPDMFKVLSFSPFPSLIDGYNNYRQYQKGISPIIPYNANIEVFKFGSFYVLFYILILFFGLRVLNRSIKGNLLLGLLISFPAFIFFIASQQYPLRNHLRFLYLSIIASLIYNYYLKKQKIKKRNIL